MILLPIAHRQFHRRSSCDPLRFSLSTTMVMAAGGDANPALARLRRLLGESIGVEVRYRTWVPVVVFDTPACNGWKSSWGGPIFDKNTRGVVLVAPGPKWDALRVIPGGIILIPEVSF